MKWWIWFLLGAGAGALALFVWQHRDQIGFAVAHRDQISAAGDVLGGLSDAWGGVEKLLGRN